MTRMGELEVEGGTVNAYVAEPESGDAPGVALYHAWWGLNDDVKAFADRLAAAGFHVLAPDMFGGAVATEIEDADRLSSSAEEGGVDAIALAAIDRLAARPGAPTAIGAVGFSFGAAYAVWVAGRRDQVAGSVAYYGSVTGPTLARGSAPVLGHFAADDPYETDENVAEFEQGLRDAGRDVTIHRYPGTGHWFAEPSRDVYRPEAADLAFERTVAFLRDRLGSGTGG
jgi:carboxymethylenebutenolidase